MFVEYAQGKKHPSANPETSADINDFWDAGYILEKQDLVVDIDCLPKNKIKSLIKTFDIKTQIEWTDRGAHLYFQKPEKQIRKDEGITPLGFKVELKRWKRGSKNNHICCKRNGVKRPIDNEGRREPFPDIFQFGARYQDLLELGLQEGDGRNNRLYKHKKAIMHLKDWRKILRFVNENILEEPLSEKEFESLSRDEAFSGVAEEEYEMAEYLMRELGAVDFNKKLYVRNENREYVCDEEEIPRIVYQYCPGKKSYFVEEVIKQMRMRARRIDSKTEFKVKFRNGYLYRGKFFPTEEFDDFTPYVLDVVYNPDARPVQIVDDYLDQLSGGDKAYRDRIIEIISHCFIVNKDFKRMLAKVHIIRGGGGNGKGSFLQIIRHILGAKNCSSLSLSQMKDERYLYNMVGRMANLGDDINARPIDDEQMKNLKNISTCDTVEVRKMRENSTSEELVTTLIFTSNHLIKSFEKSEAYKRRVDWLPIFSKPKKPDPMLISKVTTPEALEYWIKLAVDGYFRLYENKGFTYTTIIDEYNKEYHEENDNTIVYLENLTREQILGKRPPEIYELYESWCNENGDNPLSKSTLKESIQRKFGLIVKPLRIKTGQTSQVIRAYTEPSESEKKRMVTEYEG